jgi:hypothetical protein
VRSNTSSAECDLQYLEKVTYTPNAKFGYYVGAFGTYEILEKGAEEWLDAHTNLGRKFTYRVVLNDGIYGLLPDAVSDALSNHSAVLARTEYGHYLITRNWQIAVNPETPNIPDFLACDPVDPIMEKDYEQLNNLVMLNKLTINLGSVCVEPLSSRNGFLRVRQITKL